MGWVMGTNACRLEVVNGDLDLTPDTLGEIVAACWDGRVPDNGALRDAVCALSLLLVRDQQALQRLAAGETECRPPMGDYSAIYQLLAHSNRMVSAFQGAPGEAVEDAGELGNSSTRARRQVLAMLSNVTNRGFFQ